MNKKEWRKWLYWFSFAVAVIAVYKVISSVSSIFGIFGNFFQVIAPFFMALLLAYILYMPCKGIENALKSSKKKFLDKHSRGLSVFLTYLITFLTIFIIINFVIPNVVTSIKDLIANVPNYYNSALEYLDNLEEDSILAKLKVNEYIKELQEIDILTEAVKWIDLENINSYIQGIVGATKFVFDLFVTVVVSVYMLLERSDIKSFLVNLSGAIFSKKTNESISTYFRKTNSIFFSYISGQIIDAVVVGFIIGIALSIMKVKYGILLGFLVGLFNIIPYFGAIIAIVIAVLITVFTGGVNQALIMAITVIILQQIDSNIINPKILGDGLKISPVLVIFAVTVGGEFFGIIGMFLSVPIAAIIKVLITDFMDIRIKIKSYRKKLEENSKIEIE